MTRIKILEIYATVLLIAGVVALLYVWMASPLGTSDRVGITMAISTVALVIVTGIYAWHTRKMAEEMREQNLLVYKPAIVMSAWVDGGAGKRFVKGIRISFRNDGRGSAVNVELLAEHALFKFNKVSVPFSVSPDPQRDYDDWRLRVEEPNVDEDPGVSISPSLKLVANYDDVLGNPWHSTRELLIDLKSVAKDLTAGRLEVALSGYYGVGGNLA